MRAKNKIPCYKHYHPKTGLIKKKTPWIVSSFHQQKYGDVLQKHTIVKRYMALSLTVVDQISVSPGQIIRREDENQTCQPVFFEKAAKRWQFS